MDSFRSKTAASVYRNIVRKYGLATGISTEVKGLRVHSLRATAATNALSMIAISRRYRKWLGHANVSTTRLYDRRNSRPEALVMTLPQVTTGSIPCLAKAIAQRP